MTEVSIVLPAHNEGPRLCQTLAAIRDTVQVPYEVIVVNDGSTDSGCDALRTGPDAGTPFENLVLVDLPQRRGVAAARNLGAERARAPVLVAMDAHCIPRPGWLEPLLEQLHQPGVGIVAPQISSVECPQATTFGLTIRDRELGVGWLGRQADRPYPVPLAGCACLVMRREFFEAAGRFDGMRSYGMEDVELCIRTWLLGYSVIMVPGAEVAHWFKKNPFPVNWHDYVYNRLRTAVLHFDGDRLKRILASLQGKPAFADAVASLLAGDIWERRERTRQHRQHDAEWFCRKFEIAL
ncbi:MAG TPA: glycosyltransferase [Bryobacteraceae bacterium]|nr:glycosyltransferase [Bryobacteraceae bacterium]